MSNIAILTSGGDSPGMNAAVMSVARNAAYYGIPLIGIKHGYNGLLGRGAKAEDDFIRLDLDTVLDIADMPGTYLRTARCREFLDPAVREKAAKTLRDLDVSGLVVIGGDGSFQGAMHLCKLGIPCIGIPGTIDNDISCTNYCIGFDTAANTAIECIDKLRDTMQSHERCSVVEVMGRNAGYLAMYVGLAVGATAVLVPEEPIDFERDVIEKIRQARFNGFTHYMIVVAEGAGSAADIAAKIKDAIDLDPRVTVLGHIQRGGSPTGRDRVNATKMGYLAVELLLQGKTNRIVCTHMGDFTDVDISEGLAMKKSIQKMEVDVLAAMTGI